MSISRHQNAGKNHTINTDNKSLENTTMFKCLGTVTNENYTKP